MGIAADFVLIVVAGLVGGILARSLRLPLLVGYVLAGIVIGPHTTGPTVVQIHEIETLAEIGVALLLFSLGLEVSFRELNIVRHVSLIGGPIQVVLTTIAGTALGIWGLGFTTNESIWFGAMVSVSSTMVALKVMAATNTTTTLASRVMIGMLLVQDLAVIPMLIVLPQLGNPENLVPRVAGALALAAFVIAIVYFAGTRLLPPLFRRILSWGSRELFLVAVVATGVGIGAAMNAAGFSFALGAFIAGLVLSESDFSHQALSDVVPLRDIFGLMFFVTVGMLFDPGYLLENIGLIIWVVVAIILGKAAIFGGITRAFGYRNMAPWLIGLGLSQIGEFSFVLARTGMSAELISKPVYDLILTATVISMAISPLLSAAAIPLGRVWQTRKPRPAAENKNIPPGTVLEGHVVVGGYGRAGQAAAFALREANIPCLIIELKYNRYTAASDDGFPTLLGDITQDEILKAAQILEAKMILLTTPDHAAIDLTIRRARALNPHVILVARSTKLHHVAELRELGVSIIVQPELEGGLEMVRQSLIHYGRDEEESARIVSHLRTEVYGANEEQPTA